MSPDPELPIRVLFYEPYPMGLGGNFVTQRLILERLDRKRFRPIVMAPTEGAALEAFRNMDIECVVVPPPESLCKYGKKILRSGLLSRLKAALDLLRYNLLLVHYLRERGIDVIYSNCVRAQMSIGIAARLVDVPSLLYVKGELANPVIDRLCFALASKILFFCRQNRDDRYPGLVRWFRGKIDILRIGLDPLLVDVIRRRDGSGLRNELQIAADCVNVVVVGQLYRPKGQHVALEALAQLVADFPKLRLYIVGDHVLDEYHRYREELEILIKHHGLEDHVRFTGWRRDALEIIAVMDIVIHPSLAEGFGRAVLESMALGRPVIASRVGGIREIIEDGKNGFLVDPGDADAIARRLRELLENSELRERLGCEARRTVFADYLIDDKVARLADLWAEMADSRS